MQRQAKGTDSQSRRGKPAGQNGDRTVGPGAIREISESAQQAGGQRLDRWVAEKVGGKEWPGPHATQESGCSMSAVLDARARANMPAAPPEPVNRIEELQKTVS